MADRVEFPFGGAAVSEVTVKRELAHTATSTASNKKDLSFIREYKENVQE